MKLSITLHTEDYRGDHAADIQVAFDAHPDTTLGELVSGLGRKGYGARTDHSEKMDPPEIRAQDFIVIRCAQPLVTE